jgi:hypothetical protein
MSVFGTPCILPAKEWNAGILPAKEWNAGILPAECFS